MQYDNIAASGYRELEIDICHLHAVSSCFHTFIPLLKPLLINRSLLRWYARTEALAPEFLQSLSLLSGFPASKLQIQGRYS